MTSAQENDGRRYGLSHRYGTLPSRTQIQCNCFRILYQSTYLHVNLNRQRDIYFHWSPMYSTQLQTVKRPKQLSITLNRIEYSLVLAGFQMHSCWFLKAAILKGCYFQYSKCSGLHFRKFNPFQPINRVLLALLLAIFLCEDLKQISIVKWSFFAFCLFFFFRTCRRD